MNLKVNSSDLNRMMKIISQCIDTRDTVHGNIEIIIDNNMLSIRGANNTFCAVASMPCVGASGESFCVDGEMFGKVCSMNKSFVEIITDSKTCTIKGVGRTRLPLVDAKIPSLKRLKGKTLMVNAGDFRSCYDRVAYAVSTDETRVVLTGVMMESVSGVLRMAALDGFQMSVEETKCAGDDVHVVIPAAMMKLIATGTTDEEDVKITVNDSAIQAETSVMLVRCGLLAGEFPPWQKIVPNDFKVSCRVNVAELKDALKAGSIVNNKQNLVKLDITADSMRVMNNSETADYEAEIPCATRGNSLKIAFNQRYLASTISTVDTEEADMNFNGPTSPVVVLNTNGQGIRLVLPVRIAGGQ